MSSVGELVLKPSIPSAEKYVTDSSARKQVTDAMRGKTIYLEDPKGCRTLADFLSADKKASLAG